MEQLNFDSTDHLQSRRIFAYYSPNMGDHSLSLEAAASVLAGRNECNVQNATSLRRELSFRNQTIAKSEKLLHALTDGQIPIVIFGESGAGKHGNFHPESYQSIRANAAWASRLVKVILHTGA